MAIKDKKIVKFGNSIGVTIDKPMQFATGFKDGDTIEVVCTQNKIVITKKKGE